MAAKPAQRNHADRDREQECRVAAELEDEIGEMRADGSDPVVHRRRSDRPGRDVERRVERRIRKQAQGEKYGQAEADEADELVEALIFSWCKNAHKSLRLALMLPTDLAKRWKQKALDGQAGEGSRTMWVARALARGAQEEERECADDYSKQDRGMNRKVWRVL